MDKRYRILAVDDEYVNTQLIKSVLREEHDILTALNGHEAIDLVKQYKPDLILLDVMMPDLNGFEVCKIIRADAEYDSIPIIFLTALDTQDGALQGLELGGIDYLTKPVNLELLKLRVRNHLAMKEQRDLLTRQKAELEAALAELQVQHERQRVADEALREAEWKFRALFDNGPIGVAYHSMIYDDSGKAVDYSFIDANEKYIELTGVDPRGKTVLQAFPGIENDPFDWIGTFGTVARTGESIRFEQYLQPNDRWYDVVGYQYKPDHFVAAFLEITERKKAEEEKQLLEQKFQQAQKMESLGVLAGGIAHDFNNILAIIIGNCSLAERNPDRASERIPIIEKAADRAAALCRQMLAYAGKASFILTQVNMAALVDEMVQMLKATTNQNVAIRSDLSPDIPAINGDASQLRQIVMNLIINASEAIGESQGVIHISLTKKAIKAVQSITDHLGKAITPGWYACLEVSDTGCGMDEETMRRIFEPFYTTKFAGRGLGMSAVLGIITAHKGALQLTSQPGQGTTFTIYLPIETKEPIGDESGEQIISTPWQGSGTVLLVEDEEQVKLVAKAMLEELGFKVIEASNGREALDLHHDNSGITLVLTDIGMPIMDGYTLFRELKAVNPKLPIIISSGFGDTVVTSRFPREAIAGLVSKPYRFDQLRDVVKRVVVEKSK